MKLRSLTRVTPQEKIMAVNKRFGNPGLKKQQGSTIEIYDSIQVDGTEILVEFFEGAQNRQFPFTNLTKGQLTPQESFAMERAYFAMVTVDDATGDWLFVDPLTLNNFPAFNMGQVEFQIENQRVLKPIPVRSFAAEFNPASDNDNCNVLEFDTQLIIPPLQSFKASLQLPPNWFTPTLGRTNYLVMTIGGAGGIFAPKSNY